MPGIDVGDRTYLRSPLRRRRPFDRFDDRSRPAKDGVAYACLKRDDARVRLVIYRPGLVVDICEIQPFIVVLAGLFLLRGACLMVSLDSVPIRHPFIASFAATSIPSLEDCFASSKIMMLVAPEVAIVTAHFARTGSDIHAIGGDRDAMCAIGVSKQT
jgi:hypothetical protein